MRINFAAFTPRMTLVERYDENGAPIYGSDSGPLNNLWKHMAIINEQLADNNNLSSVNSFDYNEFFKRLYLSRAELDITNSVLQLLLQDASVQADNIAIEAIHHEEEQKITLNPETSRKIVYGLKTALLKEIANELMVSSQTLWNNRNEEHDIVSGVLLKLREKFRWNLVRISAAEQVQVNIDYQEMTPIIGIDVSPYVLFKDSKSNCEQYNYRPSHQIGGDSMALILRKTTGQLCLLLQSKLNVFAGNVQVGIKDLATGKVDTCVLYEHLSSGNLFEFSADTGLQEWNAVLEEARNRIIFVNIMKVLASETSKYPQDILDLTDLKCKIQIQDKCEFWIQISTETAEATNSEAPMDIYRSLLKSYLASSGKKIDWAKSRHELTK